MMPKYSIFLPVRNGINYLKLSVNSVLAQTFHDWELYVLIHDSTDGSLEWLNSIIDPRVKIRNASGIDGISANWKRILECPKGTYMSILGYDDILHPNFLEKIDCLIFNNPDASLFLTHFDLINSQGEVLRKCKKMDSRMDMPELLGHMLKWDMDINATGYVFKSSDYEMIGGMPSYPNLLFADYELWLRLSGISYLAVGADNCFSFRIHQSTTKSSSDVILQKSFYQFIDYVSSLGLTSGSCKRAIMDYFPFFVRIICKSYSHRLLRATMAERHGLKVKDWQDQCRQLLRNETGSAPGFFMWPEIFNFSVIIDSSPILRKLFLKFKKAFPDPVF